MWGAWWGLVCSSHQNGQGWGGFRTKDPYRPHEGLGSNCSWVRSIEGNVFAVFFIYPTNSASSHRQHEKHHVMKFRAGWGGVKFQRGKEETEEASVTSIGGEQKNQINLMFRWLTQKASMG